MTRFANWKMLLPLALLTIVLSVYASRSRQVLPPFEGPAGDPERTWPYAIDAREKCWLRFKREQRPVIRVNCFAIDGTLYTHSSRMVPIANLLGESWTATVVREPHLEVLIEGSIYALRAERIAEDATRRAILTDRHYNYIPDAIQVYQLLPR